LDHVILVLGVEVDLVHRHRPWVRRVHELARHRARRRLQTQKNGISATQDKNATNRTRTATADPAETLRSQIGTRRSNPRRERGRGRGRGRKSSTSSTLARPSCSVVLIQVRISLRPTK
jgi:hypothetical protein